MTEALPTSRDHARLPLALLAMTSNVGQAFLGSQGDIWDAQWDMLLALIGAAVALPLLGGVHNRSIARVPAVT